MIELLTAIDLLGTLVFAISGVLAGIHKKFDLVGCFILGLVTAIGGGSLRDILIGQTPVAWMQNIDYLLIVSAALPICYLFQAQVLKMRRSMFLFDTIGIGLFTVLGLQKTLALGLHPAIAVMMGVVSAVFGGVIRDVLSNEVPLIFRKEIYASACLAGGLVYLIFDFWMPGEEFNILPAIVTVILIRYLAVKYGWSLQFDGRS